MKTIAVTEHLWSYYACWQQAGHRHAQVRVIHQEKRGRRAGGMKNG